MPLPVAGSPAGRRELLIAGALLGLLAFAMYLPHVIRGGWYYDDWAWVSTLDLGARDGIGGLLEAARTETHRPLFGVWMSALYAVGGEGQAPYLAAGAALVAVEGTLAYLVLRLARLSAALAAPLAAMLVVLPVVDATRLWTAAFPATGAMILLLAGVAVALVGLRRTGRAAIGLHAAALVLYACAILTYELVAPLVGLVAVLYLVASSDRRAALRRWPADVVVGLVALALMAEAGEERRDATFTPSFLLDRVEQMGEPVRVVFGSLLPFEAVLLGPVGVLLAFVLAIGAGVALGAGGAPARAVRHWGVVAGAGVVFAVAGLVMLLPADPYFVPKVSGVGNRTSTVAALGLLAVLVALTWIAATALAALVRRPSVGVPVAIAALVVTTAGMAQTELRHQDNWATSWKQSQEIVGSIRRAVGPDVPAGSGVVTFRHALFAEGDVPVFAAQWDLRGAVRLIYDDPTVVGYPWIADGRCQGGRLVLGEGPQPYDVLEYGNLYFVDVPADRAIRIRTRAECEQASEELSAPQ
jgi:hypothetical protein